MTNNLSYYTITASASFWPDLGNCNNSAFQNNTVQVSSLNPAYSAVYTTSGTCPQNPSLTRYLVKIVDGNGVEVSAFGNTCFNGASCTMVGKQPVTITTYGPFCPTDYEKIDCPGEPNGVCCFSLATIRSLCARLNPNG